jgi:hypothetical protein
MSSTFATTLHSFCEELSGTYPELDAAINRARAITADRFWSAWKNNLDILLERDFDALLTQRRGLLVGAVQLTPALWNDISGTTKNAIWRYLRTLLLEAAMEVSLEGVAPEVQQQVLNILTAERLDAGGKDAEDAAAEMFQEALPHLQPLMDRLKGMMGSFMDLSGIGDIPMPEIPERLRKGRIAKLAEEMAKQFDPAEFGIDPALLKGENVEEILKRLAEMYQRDPTLLIAGAKKMADKIRKQILGGSLDRDALVAEAQEFVNIFKEHPLFKEALSKLQSITGEGGLGGLFGGDQNAGAPSARLSAVQERLRKKLEARKAGKK